MQLAHAGSSVKKITSMPRCFLSDGYKHLYFTNKGNRLPLGPTKGKSATGWDGGGAVVICQSVGVAGGKGTGKR